MPVLDGNGVRVILETAQGTVYYPMIHLAIFTGLRRSELLGLRWCDTDLLLGTLSIVQTMQKLLDGRTIYQEPKSAKGRRMIALSPTATLALRGHRERQEAAYDLLGIPLEDTSLVFTQADGSPFRSDRLTHGFRRR